MKKSIKLLMILAMSIGLMLVAFACADDQATVDEALEFLSMPSTVLSSSLTKIEPKIAAVAEEDVERFSGIAITMESSDPAVIANDGTITRGLEDKNVTVKVILTLNSASASKDFEFKVGASQALVTAQLNSILDTFTFPAKATSNLTVPTVPAAYPDVTLTFTSSDVNVISNTGVVTPMVAKDASITITVALKKGSVTASKEFVVAVDGRAPSTDAEKVAADLELIKLPAAAIADITLPTAGTYGSAITWETNNAARITAAGVVNRRENNDDRVTMTATVTSGTVSEVKYIDVTVLRTGTNTLGVYARATKNNQMFWFSLVNGEVWLDYAGIAFVNPNATTRKIEFAMSHQAETAFVSYETINYHSGWFDNSITDANTMYFNFHINLSEVYKELSPAGDWVKFYMRVTEDGTTTYLRNASSNANGLSVCPTGGSGISETWPGQGADLTLQSFTDKYGSTYNLKFSWGQIHFMKA